MQASQTGSPLAPWKPRFNPWLIAMVVALAAFMEVLDTSICNVALPHIAGGLGSSEDESTWVLTTYLVSNAIVLPITGWISSAIGRKRFFLLCIVLFMISSLLCGIAPSLQFLLFARVLQGAGGGGMQPMAQAIMADSFPPHKRGQAFALFGVTTVVAPALGPTLGGWITDNYTWRWIFFINIPVGLLTLALVYKLVEDPPFLRRFKPGQMRLDGIGFALLALGVGALQILLDKGQEDDWFSSRFIVTLAVIVVVCLGALIPWEWRHKQPIVDVHLFRSLNFCSTSAVMFMAGVVMFVSTILMPQFLQTLAGYTAVDAGIVVSIGAASALIILPIAGLLTGYVPAKYLVIFGWILSAIGSYFSSRLISLNVTFGQAALIMVLQYAPIGFIFIPTTTAAYFGIPHDRSDSVSGLTNFMRNIGSSVGTSIVQTLLARRTQFHINRLGDHLTLSSTALQVNLQDGVRRMVQLGIGRGSALTAVVARAYEMLVMQAMTLSYQDAYVFLVACGAVMFCLSFLLKSNDPKHTEVAMGH
jgi:DHA2 family multidrug resistance protein